MVRVQDDLFAAINEDWLKTAKIRPDMPSASAFTDLYLSIEDDMRADTEVFAKGEKNSPAYLKNFIDFYKLANDWQTRNAQAAQPVVQSLKRITALTSFEDFSKALADLDLSGYSTSFNVGVTPDFKQADRYIFWVDEPATILPDSTYYAADNPQKEPLLATWSKMTTQLLMTAGYSADEADKIVQDAKQFDALLPDLVLSREEQMAYYKNYHPKAIHDFAAYLTTIDLQTYVNTLVGKPVDKVILSSERFWDSAKDVYTDANWSIFKSWLIAKNVAKFSSLASYDLFKQSGTFSRALTGAAQAAEPAREAYALAHQQFGFLLGEYFRIKHFSPEAKHNVETMINKMISVYRDRLTHNDWLGSDTIKKAISKLDHIAIKIGYPDQVPLRFLKRKVDLQTSLLENFEVLSKQEAQFSLDRWNTKVDTTEWGMTADTVNAYYDPQTNSINFPAGILQAPFYDFDRGASANYGGIGAVIAHEVSHAFDTNGARFDEKGSLNNWWTDEDLKKFTDKAQAIVRSWSGLDLDGAAVNPKLTLTENIADLGGLSAALQAGHTDANFSSKSFFTTWATIWRMKASAEYIKLLTSIDEHAPNKLRANEPVKNFQEFFDAFHIEKGDGMYRAPADRVSLW
ncbi:M13 family peptidase [Oenococcus sicerae]|uniref:M13 family peptidase n=1 Tax=Oenococcus sicerae TaxID=2203724 RepID=A0ABX5QL23_9LACO|nr:M13-type metalloendopeptidase [Oenococcus sicerae]QAS69463.1 M13 family peptidase [Oenococcus sicerae]